MARGLQIWQIVAGTHSVHDHDVKELNELRTRIIFFLNWITGSFAYCLEKMTNR